ncbi:DUF421 domain-containing protein [Paenibacillus sp. PL2-23]|uniref:DUF421 domain-containing protein n=1 Tax=Paenibacillus sp. PL2-23 TaxID=2100729 RepID=UPI0030F91308
MSILNDTLLVLGRIYTIYPLLLVVTLFMGRRSIGQLPIFDFLIFLSLGSVIGADIADPKIEHLHTAIAIAAIGVLQKLFSVLLIKSRKFGKLVTFEPAIVVHKGQLLRGKLKKLQYSVDDILRLLREQGIFDPAVVEIAVLEGNGELSVLKKAENQHSTPAILGIPNAALGLAYAVIKEGKAQRHTLEAMGVSEEWLERELKGEGLTMEEVFFATLNESKVLTVSTYSEASPALPVFR